MFTSRNLIERDWTISPGGVWAGDRKLLDRTGAPIVSNLGNPWKGIYHTGRALAECLKCFQKLGC